MLVSGNDAAIALACHTAGSVAAFAGMMNDKARALGMTGSAFQNPNGLDAEGHYSTARDMAKLACAALENETFRAIVSTKSTTVDGQTLVNHNRLLRSYDGAVGVKTGYTKTAGPDARVLRAARHDAVRVRDALGSGRLERPHAPARLGV